MKDPWGGEVMQAGCAVRLCREVMHKHWGREVGCEGYFGRLLFWREAMWGILCGRFCWKLCGRLHAYCCADL